MAEGIKRPKGYQRLRDRVVNPPHPCECAAGPKCWPGIPVCNGCGGDVLDITIQAGAPHVCGADPDDVCPDCSAAGMEA